MTLDSSGNCQARQAVAVKMDTMCLLFRPSGSFIQALATRVASSRAAAPAARPGPASGQGVSGYLPPAHTRTRHVMVSAAMSLTHTRALCN